MKKRVIFFLSTLFCLSICARSGKTLFLSYDRGDGVFIDQFSQDLLRLGKSDFEIINFGSAREIIQNKKFVTDFIHPERILQRDFPLQKNEKKRLREKSCPSKIMTGMASKAQGEALILIREKCPQVKIVAVYDNLDSFAEKKYIQSFLSSLKKETLDELYILHPYLKEEAKKISVLAQASTKIIPWPVLNKWKKKPLRRQMVIVGDFESNYEERLESFLNRKDLTNSLFPIILVPHPKKDGEKERKLKEHLSQSGMSIRIFQREKEDLFDLLSESSHIVVSESSIGQQAILLKKNLFYLGTWPSYYPQKKTLKEFLTDNSPKLHSTKKENLLPLSDKK